MSKKTIAVIAGVITIGLLVALFRKKKTTAAPAAPIYECAFCTERFSGAPTSAEGDPFMLHMMDHIRDHFGDTGAQGWIPEDFNNDGVVDLFELVVIGQHWGQVDTISLGGEPEILKVVFST